MLTDRLHGFYAAVHAAMAVVGTSAPKIADRVMSEAFPDTAEAAEREGADRMLRTGVVSFVTNYLKRQSLPAVGQGDFADVSPDFQSIVKRLSNPAHYVPSLEQYMPVAFLISHPAYLDEARRHKRQKGVETLAEADVLDELYHAVTDHKSQERKA